MAHFIRVKNTLYNLDCIQSVEIKPDGTIQISNNYAATPDDNACFSLRDSEATEFLTRLVDYIDGCP